MTLSPAVHEQAGQPVPAAARRGRRVMLMLALFSIISFGDKAVLGLAGPSITDDLHLSNTEFGAIGSSFYLLFSASTLFVGLVGTRWRSRWLLAALAVIWSAAQLPIVVPAAGFGVLVATRVLLGAGEGPGVPMANHVGFTWFPADRRTVVSGVIATGGAIGVIVGGPLLAAEIAFLGWRWAFALLGVFGLIWTAFWLRIGGDGPHADDAPAAQTLETPLIQPAVRPEPGAPDEPAPDVRIRDILLRRTFLAGVIAGFSANWVLGLALSWLPTFLEDEAGYSARTVGFLVGLPSFVAVVAVPVVALSLPRMVARGIRRRRAHALLALGLAVPLTLALAGLAASLGGPLLLLCVAVAFGAEVAFLPLVAASVADLVPPARCRLALGILGALTSLGSVAAPAATGRLLDLAGNRADGFAAAFGLAAVLIAAGGVALAFLDPDRDAPRLLLRARSTA